MLDFIVLGMLFQCEGSGYTLKKHIENGVGVFYRASYGSLYPTLKKLLEKGLLTVRAQESSRGKKVYQSTQAGKDAFMVWLAAPIALEDTTNSHLAKVYFFDRLPPEERKRQLLEYENNNRAYLQRLRLLEQKYEAPENLEHHYYKLSTLYYGIWIIEETIRWCRHIRLKKIFPKTK